MIHRNYSIMLPKRNVASAFGAQKVKPQIIGNNNNFAVSFHVLCCACFSQKAGAFLRLFPRKSTTQFLNKDKIFFLRISGAAAEGKAANRYFPASKEQFTFLPLRASLLQHQAGRREHDRIDLAGTMGTYCDTAHTGNARFFIHLFGIFFVDGLYWTRCCTGAAVGALFCRFGYHTDSAGFFVRTIAGDRRF